MQTDLAPIAIGQHDAAPLHDDLLNALVGVTRQLFGDSVRIKQSRDPEFGNEVYWVLVVDTSLPPEEIVRRELRWSRDLARLAPNTDSIRLDIRPA